jgi:Fur family ferric uptake transcriptional regulator
MTRAPDVPPLVAADPDAAVAALRAAGLRASTPRRLVIEALFEADGPVSAARLAGTLRIDESSVYRNLEVLERHGLVRHLHLGHGPGLYLLVAREGSEYLYCERCETARALAPAELDAVREQIHSRFGYTVRFTHFALVGLCERCAGGEPAQL